MDPLFWPILLLVVGLGLIVLEFFVPSGSVLSIVAAVSVIAGIVLAFMASATYGVVMLGVTTVLIPTILAAAVRWWPHTPIGRMVLLTPPENPDEMLPDTEAYRGLTALIGQMGTAKTKMLPSGTIMIEGRNYDAISEGMPIEPRQLIQVVDVRTNRIVVRPAEGELPSEEEASDDILSQPIDSLGLDDIDQPQ